MDRHGPCRTRRPAMTLCFILFLEQQQRHMLFFSRIRSVSGPLPAGDSGADTALCHGFRLK